MRSLIAFFDSATKIIGGAGALVALVAGAVALYFVFRPNDKPQPAPAGAKVSFGQLTPFAPIPLGVFFDIAGESQLRANYTPAQLKTIGVYYALPVSLIGLRNVETQLFYSVYRASDRAAVEQWIRQNAGSVKAPREDFTYVAKIWIQLPQLPGSYFAAIEVDSLKNQSLALTETPPFAGSVRQPTSPPTPPPSPKPPPSPSPTPPPPPPETTTHPAPPTTVTSPPQSTSETTTPATTTTPAPTTTIVSPAVPVRPPVIIATARSATG